MCNVFITIYVPALSVDQMTTIQQNTVDSGLFYLRCMISRFLLVIGFVISDVFGTVDVYPTNSWPFILNIKEPMGR